MNRTDESEQVINNGANLVSSGHFQMPYDIVRDGGLIRIQFLAYFYFFLLYVGIEQNFQEKCRLVKEHIDDLKLRIERLEANQGTVGVSELFCLSLSCIHSIFLVGRTILWILNCH